MADTKKLDRKDRKQARRKARKELKSLYNKLTSKQRSQFNKEKMGIKQFLDKLKAEAEAS